MNEYIKALLDKFWGSIKFKPYKWGFILILFVISILVAVPVIINIVYLIGHSGEKNTSFSASDMILFYGSFLTFIGTASLGALALYQNYNFDKINRTQNRLSIRPYLFTKIGQENIVFLAENHIEYCKLKIENDKITHLGISRNRPSLITEYLKYTNEYDILQDTTDTYNKRCELLQKQTDSLNSLNKRYALMSYKLGNYGNAAAVNVNILLNNENLIPLFSVNREENMLFYFLCDFEKVSSNKNIEFKFEFNFCDIEGFGPYIQTQDIYIDKLENGLLQLSYEDQISEPK